MLFSTFQAMNASRYGGETNVVSTQNTPALMSPEISPATRPVAARDLRVGGAVVQDLVCARSRKNHVAGAPTRSQMP